MKTFRSLHDQKLLDPSFKYLFEQACHVCSCTMRIFQKTYANDITNDQLALEMKVDEEKIKLLADADHCDPQLVIDICNHLGLPAPTNCPRTKKQA